MKNFFFTLAVLLVLMGCNNTPQAVDDYGFNDYALYDQDGNFHRFSNYNNEKAIVLFVQGNGCPMVRQEYPDYNKIASDYTSDGYQFFMINSNTQDDRAKIKAEAASFSWEIPVLDDSAQLLAEELNITVTTEVFVLEPTSREILYRGPISDKYSFETQKTHAENEYLRMVLDDISEGKKPSITKKFAKGCKVNRISGVQKNQLTYTKDIAPILKQNCIRCHNDNGMAPWSMSEYKTIKGWSPMIKEVLLSKRMPPYRADPLVGSLKDREHLDDSSASKLIRWINDGSPRGNGEDILASLPPSIIDWALGEPDQIVVFPEVELPSTGLLDYYYQDVELKNKEGKWLVGMAVKFTNQKVVHHITFNKKQNSNNPINDRKKIRWADDLLPVILPGELFNQYPKNTGVYLNENATISFQIHYVTTGKTEKNTISVGFYYADTPPEKEIFGIGPSIFTFEVPPYEANAKYNKKEKIDKDILLHFATPHMHYRGEKTMVKILYPDNRLDTILSVQDYNFNWQWRYKFKDPIKIPAGSVIDIDFTLNNSYQNPFNPDPGQKVHFGEQASDEMMMVFMGYTLDN